MEKSINEKEVSKKNVTVIKNETYYQLMIASYKDMVSARICINHLNRNGIKATLNEWNDSFMVLSQKYEFKQSALREKARIEELIYKLTFI